MTEVELPYPTTFTDDEVKQVLFALEVSAAAFKETVVDHCHGWHRGAAGPVIISRSGEPTIRMAQLRTWKSTAASFPDEPRSIRL